MHKLPLYLLIVLALSALAAFPAPAAAAQQSEPYDASYAVNGTLRLPACGSIGRTSSKSKPPWQRKRVAIRRIKF